VLPLTLNITVAARWMMAQSSDFRLTIEGRTRPVSETAQKQVVLQYFGWSGLICYTGIASWNGHDTEAWLSQVLTHEPGQRTPQQVISHVVTEANKWLIAIPPADRRHTFTLITYQNRVPHIYVLSTFERGNGVNLPKVHEGLIVSRIRPRGPRTVVTGQAPAVTQSQRANLESVLAHQPDPRELRHAVALTSRDAASRANGKVSEACVVAHLLPDGSGEAQIFGNMEAQYIPALIQHGINTAVQIPKVKQFSEPVRLVGVVWTGQGEGEMSVLASIYREIAKQAGDGWPDVSPATRA
jgi:hypothetical protein